MRSKVSTVIPFRISFSSSVPMPTEESFLQDEMATRKQKAKSKFLKKNTQNSFMIYYASTDSSMILSKKADSSLA